MSDAIASQSLLDPDRPWLTDEEQMPSRMSWFDTFFNPTGQSPKLHFTRAWTILFFAGVITWAGVGFIIFIMGVAGADTGGLSVFHGYMIAVVLAVTSVLSYVIHTRRLNHAGKISLRAIIVLVPLVLATLSFVGGMTSNSAEYDRLYQQRAEYLSDPAAWRDARLDERRKAQEEAEQARLEAEAARAEAEANGEQVSEEEGQRGQRGQRGGGQRGGWNQGPSPENPLPSKEAFIVRPNLGGFSMTIVGLNTLIMIWSLLWVARVPNFGRQPEPDLDPFST
ncbi:MAG: hypothetical protein AAF437_05000 [Pseudomonadota bacterium]